MSKTLLQKLGEIQATLKAPKNLFNKFGGYKYRSAETILEAVKPLLAEKGIVLLISDKVVSMDGRFYVEARAELHDIESDTPPIHSTAYAREEETKKGMDSSQITGAASSYARKYALNGLFAIDDGVDADSQNDHGKSVSRPAPKPAAATKDLTPAQYESALKQVNESNIATLPGIEQKMERFDENGRYAKMLKKAIENKYNSMKDK